MARAPRRRARSRALERPRARAARPRYAPARPDILAVPPDFDAMLARFRLADQGRAVGEALLDQRLVAGIGNLWKAEALWAARVSPWRKLADVADAELLQVLHEAERQMRASLEHGKSRGRGAYRRVGRPCSRCGKPIQSRGQGDQNRIAYWCLHCQPSDAT